MLGRALGLSLVLLAGAPTPAAAQSAVLLPRVGGSGVGPEARDAALEALGRVLENEGWAVHALEDIASTDLPPHLAACGPEEPCAWELRARLDVDATVGVRLWGTEERVERVSVILVGVRGVGQRVVAVAEEDLPIDFAVAEAARGAIAVLREGAPGFSPPHEREEPPFDDAHLEPSGFNWLVGGLLLAGSAPLLGFAINTLVREGDCLTEGPGGTCTERVAFQEGAGIFAAVGGALLVAGVVVLALQPIRVTVHADRRSASLGVSGTF